MVGTTQITVYFKLYDDIRPSNIIKFFHDNLMKINHYFVDDDVIIIETHCFGELPSKKFDLLKEEYPKAVFSCIGLNQTTKYMGLYKFGFNKHKKISKTYKCIIK